MSVSSGGHIVFNGEQIPIGTSRFAELMPITDIMIKEIQVDDDIASVSTAIATAVMKLELELRELQDTRRDTDLG